jgi:hypothetical protein
MKRSATLDSPSHYSSMQQSNFQQQQDLWRRLQQAVEEEEGGVLRRGAEVMEVGEAPVAVRVAMVPQVWREVAEAGDHPRKTRRDETRGGSEAC